MEFSCEKKTILKEIVVAHDIISSKNVLSILSNVLLKVENEKLTIKATDLNVMFETSIPVDIKTPGSTTVFCDKFLNILRSLPDGEINFNYKEGEEKIYIQPLFKNIQFQLKCIPSDKFPEMHEVSEDMAFQLPQNDFIEMISQTIFSVSDDQSRHFLNGIYLEHKEDSLIMVATDGRRLSYIEKKPNTEIKEFKSIIIPTKILHIARRLASGEGNLLMAVTEKNIFFWIDEMRLSSTLIEGQFPNYRKVIPETQEQQLVVSRTELKEAIERVSLLVEQKSKRIFMDLKENQFMIKSEESEIGVANEEVGCTYNGPELSIAMNYTYLLDPLKVIEREEVRLELTESSKAITLYPQPEQSYFHIVMPMQLS